MSNDKDTPHSRPGLTPDQEKALATDRNISVTAGAGSGKTTILVERYLRLVIDEKIDVRNVLAITFTDKAAAEMRERVSQEIRKRLDQPSADRLRPRLLEVRERLNAAQISTIHAFCSRLLREFAVQSGVDPDFSAINELQQRLLTREAIEEIFEQLDQRKLRSDVDDGDWHELLRQVPPRLLREVLTTLLSQPFEAQLLRQALDETDDQTLIEALQGHFFQELDRQLDRFGLLGQILPLLQECLQAGVSRERLKEQGKKAFKRMEEVLRSHDSPTGQSTFWQGLLDLSLFLTTEKGTAYKTLSTLGRKADLGAAYPVIIELSQVFLPLRVFVDHFYDTFPDHLDRLALANQRLLLLLYDLAAVCYRQKKEERGLLDFEDMQILTLQLLRDHPEVCYALRGHYRYIMVDEFQDTNDLQWGIIERLGLRDGQLDSDRFFVVGDPKQSIYGFRNADVRVFQHVKQRFSGEREAAEYPGNIILADSFRFLPSLNRFTNLLFRQILGSDSDNDFDVPYEPLETRRSAPDAAHIEVAVLQQEALKQVEQRQEDYVAQRICALLGIALIPAEGQGLLPPPPHQIHERIDGREQQRNILPGDIAILIPRRTRLLELEATLRRYGIPFKTIGGIGFYRRQEVHDVYHLLRFLDNPADNLALVALMRSPFAGISDAALFWLQQEKGNTYREKLAHITEWDRYSPADRRSLGVFREQLLRWQQRRDRLSLSRLVSEIFDDSLYRAVVAGELNGEQMLANIDKLVEEIRDVEQRGFVSLSDYIDSLRETITMDPREGEAQLALEDESTVKVMTIHQAKGQEFPVVFCPYLQQTPRGPNSGVRFDAERGLSTRIRDPQQNYNDKRPFLYQWIEQRRRQKASAEEKRLFYVVVTRARDQVYLSGDIKKGEWDGSNSLAWTVRALKLHEHPAFADPECHVIQASPEKGLTVQVITRLPEVLPPGRNRSQIEPALSALQTDLDKNPAGFPGKMPVHLHPVEDSPKGVTFSATQLLTFGNDPEAYFLRYHRGFFESDYEFLTRYAGADALSLLKGKIVHKILEEALPADRDEILARLDDAFFQYEIFDEEERSGFRKEIPGLLRSFIESDTARKVFGATSFQTEISLTMRLGEDFFTGTLDRIYRNEQGDWEVIDYKTNNISPEQVDKTGKKYQVQVKGYALLLAQLFPSQQCYRVGLYFLKPQRLFEQAFSPAEIEQIQSEFMDSIGRIKAFHPFGERIP